MSSSRHAATARRSTRIADSTAFGVATLVDEDAPRRAEPFDALVQLLDVGGELATRERLDRSMAVVSPTRLPPMIKTEASSSGMTVA
jgi:hypothetical protein